MEQDGPTKALGVARICNRKILKTHTMRTKLHLRTVPMDSLRLNNLRMANLLIEMSKPAESSCRDLPAPTLRIITSHRLDHHQENIEGKGEGVEGMNHESF